MTAVRHHLAAALLGAATSATTLAAPAEAPPALPRVGAVVDMGLVTQNPFVTCRDGAYSTRVGRRAVWTFADTCLSSGGVAGDQFIDNTLAGSTSLDASGGITLDLDLKDTQGVPVRFIPYTQNELDFNAQHAPNEIALWAQDIVDDPARQRVLLFYGAVYRGSKIGYNGVGGGIAMADEHFQHVTRPVESTKPGAREPSYMWGGGEQNYTGGALVVDDMLYAYGPHGVGLNTKMRLARVPLADALDKTKWRYWNGSTWIDRNAESELATVFIGGAAGNSIFWNPWLGAFMAVYQHFADSTVWYRVAAHPEGPWSAEAAMFVGENGVDASYSAHAHPEYAEQGGQVQYISYVKDLGLFSQVLPLVKVTFEKP